MADSNTGTATLAPDVTLESAVEQAKRAFALGKFEQAVEFYATALEIITKDAGEDGPETADLYFSYGKALLENAIAQSSVLGKEQPEDTQEDESKASGSGIGNNAPILSFSGDGEELNGDDPAIDLLAQPPHDEDSENEDEHEEEEGEPEDDFNAAWEVLDLARAIYQKQIETDDDDEVKLKLADTFIALGDVSLETEKFDQAIGDYESGLDLKLKLLPTSSRQIAEAHYKLSMVLDLTSGRLSDAIVHAGKALESVEHRLAELRNGLSGQLLPVPAAGGKVDAKGKGKPVARLVRDEMVQHMTRTQVENEIKELDGLKDDLALKVEELKTTPHEAQRESAPALVAQALDKELNTAPSGSSSGATLVNDLTSIVKKKKKVTEDGVNSGKRKADADVEESSSEKKARLDTPES